MVKQIWTLSVVHDIRGLKFFTFKSEIISPLHREALSEEPVYKNGISGPSNLSPSAQAFPASREMRGPLPSPCFSLPASQLTQPQNVTYRGVFTLHWEFIQVAVGLVFLDGAVDSRFTTIGLRDGEEDRESCQDAVHCGGAVLRLRA